MSRSLWSLLALLCIAGIVVFDVTRLWLTCTLLACFCIWRSLRA